MNRAILNSDPEKLKEMAEKAGGGGGGGGGGGDGGGGGGGGGDKAALPDDDAASNVQPGQRWSEEEVLQKRADIKEFLDILAMNPTEQQFINQATGMYTNQSLAKKDRLMARASTGPCFAQPHPFCHLNQPIRPMYHTKVLELSRNVEECTSLGDGAGRAGGPGVPHRQRQRPARAGRAGAPGANSVRRRQGRDFELSSTFSMTKCVKTLRHLATSSTK